MEIEAIDLSKDDKSFSGFLTKFLPIIDKMDTTEIVGLFEHAKKLVDLHKEIGQITEPDALIKRIRELQTKNEYPPNKQIDSLVKKWDAKKIESKNLIDGLQAQIRDDIGMNISPKYINTALYRIENFKDDKKKLMSYVTNIILSGAGHAVVTELDLQNVHLSGSARDEQMIQEIVR